MEEKKTLKGNERKTAKIDSIENKRTHTFLFSGALRASKLDGIK